MRSIHIDANREHVRISYGQVPCTPEPPTVTLSPSSQTTSGTVRVSYTVTVANNDDGAETEPAPAFHNLSDTVDMNDDGESLSDIVA